MLGTNLQPMRSGFIALATALCLQPQPAQSQSDHALQALQSEMRGEIAKRCLPQFDGDKSKGELTNADLPALLNAKGLSQLWRSEALLDGHARDAFNGLLRQRYVVCVDSRMKNLRATSGEPISAVFFLGTAQTHPGPYRLIRVIAISPIPPDQARPIPAAQVVIIDAAQHIRFLHRILPKVEGITEDHIYHLPVGITSPLPNVNAMEQWRPVVNDARIRQALPTPPARPI
jgi:hypothetical protein